MEITFSTILNDQIPHFKAGIITYTNLTVGPSPQMLKGRLQLFQESLFFDLQEKELTGFKSIKEWREIFKYAGTDPSRYRPSVEALYRRIKKQNYLPSVHSALDLNNFFSLRFETPIGIYDSKNISGDVSITIGEADNEYMGLNGRINSMKNLITAVDVVGPFGSPFVDSERTKVTEETQQALQIIYFGLSITNEEANRQTRALMDMFLQIHGGEGRYTILA